MRNAHLRMTMNPSKKIENNILIPEMASLLREGKDVRFTPTGVSMRPFIEGGKDVVILRKLPDVKVGDISLAEVQKSAVTGPAPAKSYVLHRVIAIDGEQVTLLGDGNIGGTEQCTKADVLGIVIRIENANGRRKPLTRGRLWYYLRPCRRILLKVYRKLIKFGII